MKTRFKAFYGVVLIAGAFFAVSAAPAQTDDDKKFLATAAQADVNEINLSQLAEQKATDPAVKSFARKMVTEHKKMTASMKPFVESWGITPPSGIDEKHQKEYNKLNGLTGADFDKEYIDQMVKDHTDAFRDFSSEAKTTKDPKFRTAVLKGKTIVAAHKNMAYDMKKKM